MSDTQQSDGLSDKQHRILCHTAARLLRKAGGDLDIQRLAYRVGDIADIGIKDVSNAVTDGPITTIYGRVDYSVARNATGGLVITGVTTAGEEPDVVTDVFGPQDTEQDLTTLPHVTPEAATVIRDAGITSFKELANADTDDLKQQIRTRIREDSEIDLSPVPDGILTESQKDAIEEADAFDTNYDIIEADVSDLTSVTMTLTESEARTAQKELASSLYTITDEKVSQMTNAARAAIPTATKVISSHVEGYTDNPDPRARVSKIESEVGQVGAPIAATGVEHSPSSPEARYTADLGPNASDPVQTALPVLEERDYEKIPVTSSVGQTTRPTLPVGPDGEVVDPVVPVEKYLQLPLDQLIADKLGRGVPVRLIGPPGCGKNYLLKYLAYKTNRGYRSIDISRGTVAEDLFGPLTPDEDGQVVPRDGPVKQGLLNGDIVVLNEFQTMEQDAQMALHRLLNEGKLLVNAHGELVEPHPEARIVVTMNPPETRGRQAQEPDQATKERFRTFHFGYPDRVDDEAETVWRQAAGNNAAVEQATVSEVVEYAHRTRKDQNQNWPILSTRSLVTIVENIADGASPAGAVKNQLHAVASKRHDSVGPAVEAIPDTL